MLTLQRLGGGKSLEAIVKETLTHHREIFPDNLVTSMELSSEQAAELYARRYDVEHDIRDLKVTLGVENMRAQSDEMVRKEMLCSMVAYNLVVQLRREAAKFAKLPLRRLSFTGVWITMQSCLLHHS